MAGHFDWTGATAPWWVTPGITLAAVWLTNRASQRRDFRLDRRRAVIKNGAAIQQSFEIEDLTWPWPTYTPEERELELALLDMGFKRAEVAELTRWLSDRHKASGELEPASLATRSIQQLRSIARDRDNWRNTQETLGRYVSGDISLIRARRRLFGWLGILRRERRVRRWAKVQYGALHSSNDPD